MTGCCRPDLLSAYLDAALTLPERREIETHLQACSACRDELDALCRIDQHLAVWGSRRVPVPARDDVRIARSIERRKRFAPVLALSRMVPAAVGSSIAALLVFVSVNAGLMYQPSPQAGGPSSTFPRHAFVTQSRPLINARRAAAIQGVVTTLPQAALRHRTQFDFN